MTALVIVLAAFVGIPAILAAADAAANHCEAVGESIRVAALAHMDQVGIQSGFDAGWHGLGRWAD